MEPTWRVLRAVALLEARKRNVELRDKIWEHEKMRENAQQLEAENEQLRALLCRMQDPDAKKGSEAVILFPPDGARECPASLDRSYVFLRGSLGPPLEGGPRKCMLTDDLSIVGGSHFKRKASSWVPSKVLEAVQHALQRVAHPLQPEDLQNLVLLVNEVRQAVHSRHCSKGLTKAGLRLHHVRGYSHLCVEVLCSPQKKHT
jgi:hypothetical protein